MKKTIKKVAKKVSRKVTKAAEGVHVQEGGDSMNDMKIIAKMEAERAAKDAAAKGGKVSEEKKEDKVAEGVKVADSKVEAKIAALLEEMSELYSKFSLGVTALAEAVKVQEALIEKLQEKKEAKAAKGKGGKEEPAADAGETLNHLPEEGKPAKLSKADKKAAKAAEKEAAASADLEKCKTACKYSAVCKEKYGEEKMKLCKSFKAA